MFKKTKFNVVLPILFLIILVFSPACDDNNPFQPIDPVDRTFIGKIKDTQGNSLENVLVNVYIAGSINNLPPAVTTVSDTGGNWSATVQVTQNQNYDIVFSRTGYLDVVARWSLDFVFDTTDVGVIAIPEFNFDGLYRIVLTWRDTPRDLDAHLTGPDGSGNRFHLYWNNRTASTADNELIAKLDVDQRSGYGPETLTIHRAIPGTYRYTVHNYSANDIPGTQDLYKSDATVRVFNNSGLLYEYKINGESARQDSIGNSWRLFEFNGETGEFIKIDQIQDNVTFDNDNFFKHTPQLKD
jgi:hypothetical protein